MKKGPQKMTRSSYSIVNFIYRSSHYPGVGHTQPSNFMRAWRVIRVPVTLLDIPSHIRTVLAQHHPLRIQAKGYLTLEQMHVIILFINCIFSFSHSQSSPPGCVQLHSFKLLILCNIRHACPNSHHTWWFKRRRRRCCRAVSSREK